MDQAFESLKRAVAAAGGQTAFGVLCGKKQGQVWYWLNKGKKLPAEHVQTVSAATGIPPHELRPDIFPAPPQAGAA